MSEIKRLVDQFEENGTNLIGLHYMIKEKYNQMQMDPQTLAVYNTVVELLRKEFKQ